MTPGTPRRAVLSVLGAVPLAALPAAAPSTAARAAGRSATGAGFAERVADITGRTAFAGSTWGMAFFAPDTGETLYALRPDELFVAASSVKVFIGGTAFEALGPDYRFRTRIHGTGPVLGGMLHGDLVLVAGGDLLLSGRIRPDGTLTLPEPDHTFPGSPPLPGDPLAEIRELAGQVHAAGVRRIKGRVRVDVSLFREAQESAALGTTMITVSPMVLDDNVISVIVTPGAAPASPAIVRSSVPTRYATFVNEVRTVAVPAQPLALTRDAANPDGTRTVTVTGDAPAGGDDQYLVYYVPSPAGFAATALTEALRGKGIEVIGETGVGGEARRPLAERISPPLREETRVMLKVSSNLHTVAWPYLIGAIAGHDADDPQTAYEAYRGRLFRSAGLEPDPEGAADARYTATTFLRFLAHLQRRPYFAEFRDTLPIMGRDGTLAGNQPDSPAAGHVYAKTGTGLMPDPAGVMVHKALAGYVQLPDRRWLTFAQFMRQQASSQAAAFDLHNVAQEAMAEIATAAYETFGRSTR
jgi:serine-type D-Ala-D-Ala carboxypeptidase/endopeptidase (penicillin-binding protein 4)